MIVMGVGLIRHRRWQFQRGHLDQRLSPYNIRSSNHGWQPDQRQ